MFLVSVCRGWRASTNRPVMALMARSLATGEAAVQQMSDIKQSNTNRSIYLGNLKYEVTQQDLQEHVHRMGCDVVEHVSPRKGTSCVVTFATKEQAKNAIKKLHDTDFMGRLVIAREYSAKKPAKKNKYLNTSVYVRNLPPKAAWQELKDYFRTIGTIKSAKVEEDGVGIVMYSSAEEAKEAVATLNNSQMMGQTLSVSLRRKG